MVDTVESLRQRLANAVTAYEMKVQDFARETLRTSELLAEVASLRAENEALLADPDWVTVAALRAEVARKDEELAALTKRLDVEAQYNGNAGRYREGPPGVCQNDGCENETATDTYETGQPFEVCESCYLAAEAARSSLCPTGEHPAPCGCLGSEGESK